MRLLVLTTTLSLAAAAPALAHDYSSMDCTAKDFAKAFQDGMNDTPQMKNSNVKILSITDVETVQATPQQLSCRGTFKFASGEAVEEIFSLKDGPDGHINMSFKEAK